MEWRTFFRGSLHKKGDLARPPQRVASGGKALKLSYSKAEEMHLFQLNSKLSTLRQDEQLSVS
jgi:hypothetical protein